MYSEKTPLITPPSFYTRPGGESDITGMMAFDQHLIRHSLLSSLEVAPTREATATRFPGADDTRSLALLAVSPDDSLAKSRTETATATTTAHTAPGVDRAKTVATAHPFGGILAHGAIFPYRRAEEQRRSFDRTAYISILSLERDLLGPELWSAVNGALLDETLALCRKRLGGYRVLVCDVAFREDEEALVALRDLFLERGFELVGVLREVSEKNGVLLGRAVLQIML